MQIQQIAILREEETRSISPENLTGEKGKGGACSLERGVARMPARELGVGWKVNPYVVIQSGETVIMAAITGSGCINHIWMTPTGVWRNAVLRMYWDGQTQPSVESPVGDFFCMGWNQYARLDSLAVCVNPGSAFNCYWPMPFEKSARITLTNMNAEPMVLYYQVDYCLRDVRPQEGRFHAQFRRVNPLPYMENYVILSGVKGKGQYVGTYLAWGSNSNNWWGEGEIKFYLDGDKEYPTICGTGTEDYFCGSYNFENPFTHRYEAYCTPYAGLHQILLPDGLYKSQTRFGMYRWHITDPICFEREMQVTIQALGWRSEGRYLPLQDDISSVAFWYQTLPTQPFPSLPDKNSLEVI